MTGAGPGSFPVPAQGRTVIRALATDLDGTLVRSDGTISARSVAALAAAEEAGLLVVLVTGRPPRWIAPVAEATGHRGVAVCANGALVYDLHTETVVEERLMAPETAVEVVRRLSADLPGLQFAVEFGPGAGPGYGREPGYRPTWPPPPDSVVAAAEVLLVRPVAELAARHPELDPDALLARTAAAVGELATPTHSSPTDSLVEISAHGVTKASTLAVLCAERGIEAHEVVAIGDMPNDLPLLAWAGRGIAVANAHPSVLAAVTERTATNDDDGVAVVVEGLVASSRPGRRGRQDARDESVQEP